MEAIKPILSRVSSQESLNSAQTLSTNVSQSAPSQQGVWELQRAAAQVRAHKRYGTQSERSGVVQWNEKVSSTQSDDLSLATTGNTCSSKQIHAAPQTRNPNANLNKPALWHTQRRFNEVPLTLEGVTALQHDKRIDRVSGSALGVIAGAWIGTALAFFMTSHVASVAPINIVVMFIVATVMGGVGGASTGMPRGVRAEKIRVQGLYYTGIVTTQALSVAITKDFLGLDATSIRTPGYVAQVLTERTSLGDFRLSTQQIADIESYYRFAMISATQRAAA